MQQRCSYISQWRPWTLIRFYSSPQLPDLAQMLTENVWKDSKEYSFSLLPLCNLHITESQTFEPRAELSISLQSENWFQIKPAKFASQELLPSLDLATFFQFKSDIAFILLSTISVSRKSNIATPSQRYTDRVLQTIQMKLILLWVWAEQAVMGRAKTALKFKYEI